MTMVVGHPVTRGSWRSVKDNMERLRDCRTRIIGVEQREMDVEGKSMKDDMESSRGLGCIQKTWGPKEDDFEAKINSEGVECLENVSRGKGRSQYR